jgi:hypothetical protein
LNQLPHFRSTNLGRDEPHPAKSNPHRVLEELIVGADEPDASFLSATQLIDHEFSDDPSFDARAPEYLRVSRRRTAGHNADLLLDLIRAERRTR